MKLNECTNNWAWLIVAYDKIYGLSSDGYCERHSQYITSNQTTKPVTESHDDDMTIPPDSSPQLQCAVILTTQPNAASFVLPDRPDLLWEVAAIITVFYQNCPN